MSDAYRAERLKKLQAFKDKGIDPFTAGPFHKQPLGEVINQPLGAEAQVAGRIMLMRDMGNICFMHLQDESGRLQIVLNKKEFSDDYKFWVNNLDLGDFIGVAGARFDTQKGERSVLAKTITLLTKSLRPLPDKFKGLEDLETRLRKRYLDIMCHQETKEMVYKLSTFWNSMRDFLRAKGFVEVYTPILETVTGGGDARPFLTHHNALDIDVHLRISTGELWQKRLMVGGLEKTFEIGRQFRNEGMSPEHLQDYTQMEFYWAYADYQMGMQLVEELVKHVAQATFGTLQFSMRGFNVDLGKPWERIKYRDVVKEMTGIDVLDTNEQAVKERLISLGVEFDSKGFNLARGVDNLWKFCRKKIPGPAFLIDEPLELSPLAKKKTDDPRLVQRFHVLIGGSENGNGYSELNDPIDQAERFGAQDKLREGGDEEAQMNDADFVEALEYGMPPTCGFGLSERLFAFFMDKPARECQIFPLMKPVSD
jgi:lysyl-tRNA synthetase, class II